MIENWIDKLCNVWSFDAGNMRTVKSYRLIGDADRFPASIDPARDFPLALSIPSGVSPEYSLGGPCFGIWRGVTEFHVAPSVEKSLLPSLMKWYGKILNAAAGNMKLGGTVELFLLDGEDAIEGPLALQYGNETPHWGYLVRWIVKEHLEGEFTVSA